MGPHSDAGRRAAVASALAAGDWPWPAALRADETFIDGLCALATACERAGIDELAFAVVAADEHAERSAVARLLLQLRRTAMSAPMRASGSACALTSSRADRVECATLAEAFDVIKVRGMSSVAMQRWVADAVGSAPNGLQLRASGADSTGSGRATIAFADDATTAAQLNAWTRTFDVSASTFDQASAELEVRVDAPASAALAQWFAAEGSDDDAWTWAVPETPRPLVAPAMTFSASRLNGFVKCPRRWFFEYLCDALVDEGSAAATYGKVFHEALEALHRIIRMPAEFSGNAILERLHAELDMAFERNRDEFASPLEFEVSRLRARVVAAHYARWLRAEAQDHPMQVEAVESLQRWTMRGHTFVGFIDRIDRPVAGGPVTIYDYKTGRIDDDPREYVAKMRRGEEAQLALYYTVRRMRGDAVGRLALVSLRDPRDPVWVLALDMVDDEGNAVVQRDPRSGVVRGACTPADMQTAVDALLDRADMLTHAGVEHFMPGDDPPCSYCAYANACRERPADSERVFAR